MKNSQFLSITIIVVLTVASSFVIRELLVFSYEDYNQTHTYSVSRTLSYIRLFPTGILFFITAVYALIISLWLKMTFKSFNKVLLFQLGFLVFIWLFLNGIIGSYQGIYDYQVRKCNSNIQQCLKEERLKN